MWLEVVRKILLLFKKKIDQDRIEVQKRIRLIGHFNILADDNYDDSESGAGLKCIVTFILNVSKKNPFQPLSLSTNFNYLIFWPWEFSAFHSFYYLLY